VTTFTVRELAGDVGPNALMLPHVFAFNVGVPTKFMPSPNQRGYVAQKKYAVMADLLGLGGSTVEEKLKR
jgi:acetaldehyde dehydrogenase/alcohol dehydrogenase